MSTQTQSGAAEGRQVLALRAFFLANGGLLAAWITHLPTIETKAGIDHAQLGFALSAMSIGYLLSMPLGGILTAAIGAAQTLLVASIVTPLLAASVMLAPGYLMLAAAMVLFGLTAGSVVAAANILTIEFEKKTGRKIMSSLYALKGAGGIAGSMSAVGAMKLGIAPLIHVSAYAGAAMAVILLFSRSLPHLQTYQKSESKGLALRSATVWCLGLGAMAILMAEGSVQDWGAIFIKEAYKADDATAGLGFSFFSTAMAISCLVGDRIVARFGNRNLIIGGGLIAIIGFLLATAEISAAMTIAGFTIVGLGAANLPPIMVRLAGHVPGINSTIAVTTTSTIAFSGYVVGPSVIGFVSESYGISTGLMMPIVLCAAVVVGFLSYRKSSSVAVTAV